MTLTEFAHVYRDRAYPRDALLMSRVFHTDVSASVLVWSEQEFLVEFYMLFPNAVIQRHSHPFRNLMIFNSGELIGARGTNSVEVRLTDQDHGRIGRELEPGVDHWFRVGALGATFYNLSSWSNDSEKTSATLRYYGLPLGPRHKKMLEEHLNESTMGLSSIAL